MFLFRNIQPDRRSQSHVQLISPASQSDKQSALNEHVFLNNIKAVRDFKRRFAAVADKEWCETGDGYQAQFTEKGISWFATMK